MLDTRYLKRRVGKGRTGQRWYARVPVPKDLQARFGGRKAFERALKTADLREAQRRRHAVVAEVLDKFERARLGEGDLTSQDIEQIAQRRFQEWMVTIDHNPMDTFRDDEHALAGEGVLWTLEDELERGDLSHVHHQVQKIAQDRGLALTPERHDELARSLLKAEIVALQCSLDLHRGGVPNPPKVLNLRAIDRATLTVPTSVRPRAHRGSGLTISEAVERYFAYNTRDRNARWTRQTEVQYRASCQLFTQFMGDGPITSVTKDFLPPFLETIGGLRRDYGRFGSVKTLSLEKLLEDSKGSPGLSNGTLNRHARALSGLFKWALSSELYEGANPFSGHRRRVARSSRIGWQPFSIEELAALFAHPLLTEHFERRARPAKHSNRTALMWIPVIALFSGLREDEICGLHTGDVQEQRGILYFDVVEHKGRSVKSDAAIRKVPVHSALLEIGFREYLHHVKKQRHEYLFPGLTPGGPDEKRNWNFSKAFTVYRRAVSALIVTGSAFTRCARMRSKRWSVLAYTSPKQPSSSATSVDSPTLRTAPEDSICQV